MGKSSASKEMMGMRGKDKQGFPKVPEKDKSADDLGYMTKVKNKRTMKGK
jgi:hypothetical protein